MNVRPLGYGAAVKVPLKQLADTKEDIRSALSRAAAQQDSHIATSSNDDFLYVWKTDSSSAVSDGKAQANSGPFSI
jgi:hypothetical protein